MSNSNRPIRKRRPRPSSIERTYCACDACKQVCRTQPGDLAPGDVERIADFLGVDATDQFVEANFVATLGHLSADCVPDETVKVPTIAPAQRPDGRCVFLTSDERCSIHQVAPYGCSRFNACHSGNGDDQRRLSVLLQACFSNVAYVFRWAKLNMARKTRGIGP